jgi:GDSL-like Lipase/Acylhydrolase
MASVNGLRVVRRTGGAVGAVVVACVASFAALAQVSRLGALGDSLTDEYSEESYSYARNWTMLIVQHRSINMGPTAAHQPGGTPTSTWGEPRRRGYQHNWARSGADSASLLSQGQHTGLAAQVGPGGVSHAVVAIGANDFSPSSSAYFNIYFGLWSQSQIDSYVNGRVANVTAAVQTLQATGVGLALCNYVDYGVAPITRQLFPTASRRNRVTAAVNQVNARLLDLAQQRRLVLIDINALGTAIFGTNTSVREFLPIGNVTIQLLNRDTASNSNPLAGFVDDGAHPHTTLQGVFANVMMTALNVGWGEEYPMFTDQEILANSGIAYGGIETLAALIGPYAGFVRSFRCVADLDDDGDFYNGGTRNEAVDINDLLFFLTAFEVGDLAADLDNGNGGGIPDGGVDISDLLFFLARFEAGC